MLCLDRGAYMKHSGRERHEDCERDALGGKRTSLLEPPTTIWRTCGFRREGLTCRFDRRAHSEPDQARLHQHALVPSSE